MFKNYLALLEKADSFFSKVFNENPSKMNCSEGCSKCCVDGITLLRIERDRIISHLKNRDEMPVKSKTGGCAFLSSEGRCKIYEVRPLVCRTWGIPIIYSEGDPSALSEKMSRGAVASGGSVVCCDLNFQEEFRKGALGKEIIMNGDRILEILVAVNSIYCNKLSADSAKRFPLRNII
ncbi:MAG: Flagellin N-methylase [bacterium ADurb.Bin270]|nr:MAG: Flagellin N-methylase [bacterium ADurb.Bin270]